MSNLSKPPSITDDGDWKDAPELVDVDCVLCDARLTFEEIERLTDSQAYYETTEDLLARATCGECRKKEDGDDE
jgi:hypothetical protein